MSAPDRPQFELVSGTPVADAVTRGRQAFARGDVTVADAAYRDAVRFAAGDRRLWSALAIEHIEHVRASGRGMPALRRCDEYVDEAGGKDMALRVLRAEIRSSLGDHSRVDADAVAIRSAVVSRPDSVTPDDNARLYRVQGLSAADRGDLDGADRYLTSARKIFLEIGDRSGMARIDRDRIRVAIWRGDEEALSDVLPGEPPQTISDYLLLAVALRRQLRYEEAIRVLLRGAVDPDLDPALRWVVLYELIVLFRLIRQDTAERLLPLLREAAALSADPAAVAAAIARLSATGALSDAISPQFDRKVQHARRLIMDTCLDEATPSADRARPSAGEVEILLGKAESSLKELRAQAHTARDVSTWHLAAGELELARHQLAQTPSFAQDAVGHLSKAADHATSTALVEVRACALRLLGRACARLNAHDRAAECWAEAHRLEKHIAGRQITDNVKREMLQAVPDEHDERIRAAADALGNRGVEATAAIVVAMEAARGATILQRILPDAAGSPRDLPGPSDLNGAWRWVSDIADRLPRSQVAWIIHAAPDRVHHAVLGRGLLFHASVAVRRKNLTDAIDAHMACWDERLLELSVAGGRFDDTLAEVAAQVGISEVIPELPSQVRRIAIVAGGALSDVPFAAMTIPGGTEPLGLRFALSDLPCLSARLPLYRRSRWLRGDRLLVVSPPDDKLTPAEGRYAHTVLDGARATVATLQTELERHRHHQVRIDCHGQHEHNDPTRSWLQLAPEGPDGRLRPEKLQWMDLRGCGTLMLGACESGMAQRIGPDERIGFVRAAVHAGAPAVIAAKWLAADAVAAIVLDRFEHYVRYLPRDLALQRAQQDVYRGAPGVPEGIPAVGHPARWACWTLYGDSDWQTRAGRTRRWLRRSLDRRRHRAAHA